MRYLALALSVIGAILISTGVIGFFMLATMTAGIRALYALGGISLAVGLIAFVGHFVSSARNNHHSDRIS